MARFGMSTLPDGPRAAVRCPRFPAIRFVAFRPGTAVLEMTHSRFRVSISSYDPLAQLFGIDFAILVGAPDEDESKDISLGENFHFQVDPAAAVVKAARALV